MAARGLVGGQGDGTPFVRLTPVGAEIGRERVLGRGATMLVRLVTGLFGPGCGNTSAPPRPAGDSEFCSLTLSGAPLRKRTTARTRRPSQTRRDTRPSSRRVSPLRSPARWSTRARIRAPAASSWSSKGMLLVGTAHMPELSTEFRQLFDRPRASKRNLLPCRGHRGSGVESRSWDRHERNNFSPRRILNPLALVIVLTPRPDGGATLL
jgi:hypothetical protein